MMKKIFFLFAVLFVLAGSVKSQTILYQDNFDTYALNSFMAVNNGTWWTTWSALPGSDEDMQILNVQAHSGTQSGSIDMVSAASDCVFKFGNFTSGYYEFKFWMYIPTGNCGYYNILHVLPTPTAEWAFEVYFRTDGSIELSEGGTTLTGTYPKDTWFEVRQLVNLTTDNVWVYVNGTEIGTWPFHYQASQTTGTNQLAGCDFFAGALSGSGEIPLYYVDDLEFTQDPVGITEFTNSNLMIYPNPVADKLNIKTNENINNVTISDVNGKIVYNGISNSIDVSNLSKGVYFVNVLTDKGTINQKFIK